MNKIFVYGTLKRGYSNHHLLEGQQLVGEYYSFSQSFKMIDLNGFPGVIQSNDGAYVTGEIYQVDDVTFSNLDRLEGYPSMFSREKFIFIQDYRDETEEAWMYLYNNNFNHSLFVEPNDYGELVW